jgi:hypothetical protein
MHTGQLIDGGTVYDVPGGRDETGPDEKAGTDDLQAIGADPLHDRQDRVGWLDTMARFRDGHITVRRSDADLGVRPMVTYRWSALSQQCPRNALCALAAAFGLSHVFSW